MSSETPVNDTQAELERLRRAAKIALILINVKVSGATEARLPRWGACADILADALGAPADSDLRATVHARETLIRDFEAGNCL